MNAREVALLVVRDAFGQPARGAQAALAYRAQRAGLDARDRAFAAELAYGSIKMRRAIELMLRPYLEQRREPPPAIILEILRLGVYQLAFISGVDAHAAVFETVNLARKYGHPGTVGLVNAVLRRLQSDAPARATADASSNDDEVAAAYSLPTWLVRHWRERFGAQLLEICAGINVAPQFGLRVNRARVSLEEVEQTLGEAGCPNRRSEFVPESLIVARSAAVVPVIEGAWAIQSEAAAMPVDLLAPEPGERIFDLCSGRGNKLVQIAARLGAQGAGLIGIERDPRKTLQARQALDVAAFSEAKLETADLLQFEAEPVDAVLLDAPCSGFGIIGRHPEARWRKLPEDPERNAKTQRELLAVAAKLVRSGGRVVYSVCTTDQREGEALIDELCAQGEFTRSAMPERYASFVSASGDLLVPPGIEGRDGFFVATLRRQ